MASHKKGSSYSIRERPELRPSSRPDTNEVSPEERHARIDGWTSAFRQSMIDASVCTTHWLAEQPDTCQECLTMKVARTLRGIYWEPL